MKYDIIPVSQIVSVPEEIFFFMMETLIRG
jgi:hypothetical protein